MIHSDPRSLAEIHSSVSTTAPGFWKRLFAFAGPAYLVSVGYMDPGNWATDIEGGSRFGYQLLWVLVISNAMAVLLQTLSARLGIVTRRDLAQACRETYPRAVNLVLWLLCEIAIAAMDLAEVLGAAIALNLLFKIPLLWAVLLTAADSLIILSLLKLGVQKFERITRWTIGGIASCFAVELFLASPDWGAVGRGLVVPKIDAESLYIAVGILGATVMPHNLYLHSSLVQTRQFGTSREEKKRACWFNFIDSAVALNAALLINAAILILAAAVFFRRGIVVTEIQEAHMMLTPLLGTAAASFLFGFSLLLAGQASTLTGTLAGQVVMEGFLNIRMAPWLRRAITRGLAIIPAVLVITLVGEQQVFRLLIFSQVILSLQLPFAILPLMRFTNDKARMGEFASKAWVKVLGIATAVLILALNFALAWKTIGELLQAAPPWLEGIILAAAAALILLVIYLLVEPYLSKAIPVAAPAPVVMPDLSSSFGDIAAPVYRSILVPLDHSASDGLALRHAGALAVQSGALVLLLHVEEGATSTVYGPESSTSEVTAGNQYLQRASDYLREQSVRTEVFVRHSNSASAEIISFARAHKPNLIVMAAHGHGAFRDLIYGQTIERVRHGVKIPLFIVQ